jgi:hypothetical protein
MIHKKKLIVFMCISIIISTLSAFALYFDFDITVFKLYLFVNIILIPVIYLIISKMIKKRSNTLDIVFNPIDFAFLSLLTYHYFILNIAFVSVSFSNFQVHHLLPLIPLSFILLIRFRGFYKKLFKSSLSNMIICLLIVTTYIFLFVFYFVSSMAAAR